MNNKIILVLSGTAEGKNKFISVLKNEDKKYRDEDGLWVWNINSYNVLSRLTHFVGWDGVRDAHYYKWLQEFAQLANKHWDFEKWYTEDRIRGFDVSEKTQVLIFHNMSKDLEKELLNSRSDIFTVVVTDEDVDVEVSKVLNYKDVDFVDKVIDYVKEIMK